MAYGLKASSCHPLSIANGSCIIDQNDILHVWIYITQEPLGLLHY